MIKETKQVIVIRKDLKMRRGKEVAQGCHASLSFLTKNCDYVNSNIIQNEISNEAIDWLNGSFKKVCVQVESEQELLDIYNKAKEQKLEVHLITDSGHTEFNGIPTRTCLAIGPNYSDAIDNVTGHLKLY